ncbi:MAG: hypothetical protein DBY24_00520 [Prevotellaceae bacterium]|nr:MAG: hypothetical protein DBY24_00520 [Prevotellaceae bacterium]
MDKKCNWIVGLYTLIFGLTFGLECLIFKHKMVSFWIGEVFFALSTGGVILSFILLEKKPCEKVSGISAVLFSNIYFGLEILLSVIFAIIPFNAKWGIVIEIVPLALYCVIIYSTLVTGKFISNQDSSVDQKMKFLQLLEHNLKYARANCTDDKVCERLNVLIDKVHYSDPMSIIVVQDQETRLVKMSEMIEIKIAQKEDVLKDIKEFNNVLAERNSLCKQSK